MTIILLGWQWLMITRMNRGWLAPEKSWRSLLAFANNSPTCCTSWDAILLKDVDDDVDVDVGVDDDDDNDDDNDDDKVVRGWWW